MEQPKAKRSHRATGKPAGGARPGAGRKPGSTNALDMGQVRAIKAAGLRVPQTASAAERELADEGLDTITQVMRGQIHFTEAAARMKAAARLREEICGPMAQKVEVTGKMTLEQAVLASIPKPEGT